jgi:hypothetical protein
VKEGSEELLKKRGKAERCKLWGKMGCSALNWSKQEEEPSSFLMSDVSSKTVLHAVAL